MKDELNSNPMLVQMTIQELADLITDVGDRMVAKMEAMLSENRTKPEEPREDKLLKTRDLQKRLKRSEPIVLGLLNSGDLPGFKIGNRWVVPESAFQEWLAERSRQQRLGSKRP